jgi:hypothetical protein
MAGNLGNTDTATWSPSQIAGMKGQTLGEYQDEQSAKKREEYINSIDYNDTGGLPANLRYPYAMIDSGMDFLKIQIATYTAPDLNLSGLLDVNNEDKSDASGNSATIKLGRGASQPGAFALQNATSANSNNTGSGRALKKPKHTLYLPIPRQIQDANSVQYDSGRIDPLEAVGAALIKQGIENPSFETVSRTFDLLVNDGVDLIGMNTDAIASAIAGRAIGALGGNVTANALIARGSGAILNPNLESLFQGVKLRQFPFSFEFFPRNGREAVEVRNIIKVLKRSMSARNNRKKGKGVFIKQPDIFQLQYMKGGGEHPFLNKFLPMHLTDMKINYSQSGTYSTFHDGTPTHMTMSCSFQEVNPVYQEDYDEAGKGVGY